jgi:hypothetical protein
MILNSNQIWSVSLSGGVLSNPLVVLNSSSCAVNDPTVCLLSPDGMESVVGNINTYSSSSSATTGSESFIIITLLNSGGLLKYIPSTKSLYKIYDETNGLLTFFDGIRFNYNQSILFGTRNGGDIAYQTVFAMFSCNDWKNATLLYSFQLNCNGTNAPAVTLVTNNKNSQDLLVLCNDNFGTGPYTVQRINDVNNVVANVQLCAVNEVNYDDDANKNADNSSHKNELSKNEAILVSVLSSSFGTFIICGLVFFLYLRHSKASTKLALQVI